MRFAIAVDDRARSSARCSSLGKITADAPDDRAADSASAARSTPSAFAPNGTKRYAWRATKLSAE
jgi:hypothetical protein